MRGPYNKNLFDKSIGNIKSKNIFNNINYNIILIKIKIKLSLPVEENTGEIFAGAGTGTTGTSFTAGIKKIII